MPNHEVVWVKEGGATSVLLWAGRTPDSPVAPFAVSELQAYVRKMTGAVLPTDAVSLPAHRPASPVASAIIALSGAEAERYRAAGPEALATFLEEGTLHRVAAALADKRNDSYAIVSERERVVLAGTNERSLLYAVYDLLERLQVKFFAPAFRFYREAAEFVPKIGSTLVVPALNVAEEADFAYRRKYVEEGCSHTVENLIQLIDWMAKKRLNCLVYPRDYENLGLVKWETWRERLIPELAKRGLIVEVGGHGYDSFLPESLKAEHPDWFHKDDEPIWNSGKTGPNVFRFRNREALDAYIGNVIAYLQAHPEIAVFDGWPPDSATWAAADIAAFGSIANAQAYIANELARSLAESLPRVKLEQISYVPATEPPDRRSMYSDSVIVDCALYDRSYSAPLRDGGGRANEHYVNVFRAWREQGFQGDFCILEYYSKYSWHSLPVLLPRLMADDMAYFREIGVNGIGIYSEPANWLVYELNHLFLADLSWNAGLAADDYVAKYARDRFGPYASTMKRYFDTVERIGRLLFDRPEGNLRSREAAQAAVDGYKDARTMLERALETSPGNAPESFLVRRLMQNAEYAVAVTEIALFRALGRQEEEQRAKLATRRLVEAYCLEGIILKTTFSIRKYEDIPRGRAGKLAVASIYDLYRDAWQ